MKPAYPEPLQQVDRTCVLARGRKLIYFGGCDYLRLSSHPKVLAAVRNGIAKFGLNVAASRRTTGNHVLYERLERQAQKFFAVDCAILVSNGYLTNIVAAQGLSGDIQHAFIDARAHASLRDALAFLRCSHTEFAHRDAADLRRKIKARSGRAIGGIAVLTDGLFSHDGSIAPLQNIRKAIGPKALLWVDDAHGGGLLGKRGRGSVEAAGLRQKNLIQTVTFSKTFGAWGGAVLCDSTRGERILRQSTVLPGNTPVPLPYANAALTALNLIRSQPSLREGLWRNLRRFWRELDMEPSNLSPVISVLALSAEKLRRALLAAGIHPPFIQYPGGPANGYFRFAISSEHSPRQISALANVLATHRRVDARSSEAGVLFLGREA